MPRTLAFVLLAVWTPLITGCASITINRPAGAQPSSPVAIEVEITRSVYSRTFVVTGGPTPINVTGFNTTTKPGTQNTEVLTASLPLSAGSYTFTVSGTYDAGNGQATPISRSSTFQVATSTPTPSVTLSIAPGGDILVPRAGNVSVTFAVTRSNSTSAVSIGASGLPNGVTMPGVTVASSSASQTASLSATATANGQTNATFTAQMAGAQPAPQTRMVRVVPKPGAFVWVPAPFLGPTGPATPASSDGRFSVQASRMGTSRVWTLRVTPTTGTGSPLEITTASWGGTGGSNLAGIAFCPASPTVSALVLSDDDESDPPIAHQAGVTYRLKVIRLEGPTPVATASLEGLKYLSGVQPRLGFSADCSIVASWSIDPGLASQRNVQFLNLFTGVAGGAWSYSDSATTPNPALASISGGTITLTGPQGQTATRQVP